MPLSAKIYVAGHRGLVGSALMRTLEKRGYRNIAVRTSKELDLRRQREVEQFFKSEQPDYVFLAAAKVGGILANSTCPADFIYDNIAIAVNVIHAAYKYRVRKLLNLGSSCIYPKFAPQPLKEECLLTDTLEPTNEAYAIAKISAIKLCRYYNEQHGTDFLSVMPTNLFGPNDNFDLMDSHVLPALIRKCHLAKLLADKRYDDLVADFRLFGNESTRQNPADIPAHLSSFGIYPDKLILWGTGSPYREFLHTDDLAEACVYLVTHYSYDTIGEFINIGMGEDVTIKELAQLVKKTVGFEGELDFDATKPDGTPRKLLDVSKVNRLGWQAKISLEHGIRKTYEWYLNQHPQTERKV
ncbi:MAG: GDP-L-fucose synthase [Deltaproteobacteria bacterium]|nr:GDP-L-fucose synthase [Deltaproteobacteria bacterium]